MTRLRHGPRYSGTVASTGYGYDEALAEDMRQQNARRAAIFEAMPLYKKELAAHKIGAASKSRARLRGNERQEAEQRMVEAVCKVIGILEFHMADMMQYRTVGKRRLVFQEPIHNVIVALRTKCGISFERGAGYDKPIALDRQHLKNAGQDVFERAAEQFSELKSQERSVREQQMRRVADRLIARSPTASPPKENQ